MVVNGRTEYAEKYAELFYDLKDLGFSLYIYDHRGQGLSSRLLADRGKLPPDRRLPPCRPAGGEARTADGAGCDPPRVLTEIRRFIDTTTQ